MSSTKHQEAMAGLVDYLHLQRELGKVEMELSAESIESLKAMGSGEGGAAVAAKPVAGARRASSPEGRGVVAGAGGSGALAEIAARVASCAKCALHEGRTNTVPGEGCGESPDVMFIGEAPGAEEDRQGRPFVGRSGQLLTKMIAAMGYDRSEVFITSICKCRPPGNRQPTAAEMEACLPYLREQIAVIKPKTIVAMGNTAIQGLLGSSGISKLRGIWTSFEGIPLMPTFHPAYLLRFPPTKREAWNDLKKVLNRLGRPIPPARPESRKGDGESA